MATDRHAILRAITKDGLDHALLRHCAGESRPDHARPDAGNRLLIDRRREVREILRAHEAARPKRGRPPKKAVDVLFAGPPRHAAADAWSREKVDAWADDTMTWLKGAFPDAPIAVAALHMDEASPHVHVSLVPVRRKTFSWKKLVEDHTGQRGRASYRAMQDSYHAAVAHHGLERGDEGSERKHKKLSREAGIAAAREHAEKRAEASYERMRAKADADAKRAADSYAMRAHREARERRAREQDREIGQRRDRLEVQADQEERRRDAAKAAVDREQARADTLAEANAKEAARLNTVRAQTAAEEAELARLRDATDEARHEADERLAEVEDDLCAKEKARADVDRALAEARAEHTRWTRLVEGAKAKYGKLQEEIGMLQARFKKLASTFSLLDADRQRLERGKEPEHEWAFDGGIVKGVKRERSGGSKPRLSPGGWER